MDLNKRNLLGLPLVASFGMTGAGRVLAHTATSDDCGSEKTPLIHYDLPIASGPFNADVASLETYQTPEWFRDAKLGIWAHWGPQAVAGQGDWYARFMYVPGHPHYAHHLQTYGHPSEFGYKDLIKLWTAEAFDPEGLMDRYAAAGAKYFVSMGVHHDNFDLWNSRTHRWNATAMGPRRDIVGEWATAARRRGLRFGVSEHLGASHNWWYPSHLYDQFWPKMGVSYDGADPAYADLYHTLNGEAFKGHGDTWYTSDPLFHQIWFNRLRDLVDTYRPDLLYSDGGIPFGVVGRSLIAHLYNQSVGAKGQAQAVYNCKDIGSGEFHARACVQDVERGVLKGINPLPWQTDTSNGDWFYSKNDTYKTGRQVIHMLADIVSKNGNLLLNIVLNADGSLPPQSLALLADLTAWMKVNSEAIHGTRPWTIYGEGPTESADGAFHEGAEYTSQDIRFTMKGRDLYAIALGEPQGVVSIGALGDGGRTSRPRVRSVHLVGLNQPLAFRQDTDALRVDVPPALPTKHASVFKIVLRA